MASSLWQSTVHYQLPSIALTFLGVSRRGTTSLSPAPGTGTGIYCWSNELWMRFRRDKKGVLSSKSYCLCVTSGCGKTLTVDRVLTAGHGMDSGPARFDFGMPWFELAAFLRPFSDWHVNPPVLPRHLISFNQCVLHAHRYIKYTNSFPSLSLGVPRPFFAKSAKLPNLAST